MEVKLFLFLFLGLVFVSQVSSLGITPGRTTIHFQPGITEEHSFSVINEGGNEKGVVLSVRGELADYITFSQSYGVFESGETSKSFSYSINLPSSLDSPGKHEAEIFVLEVPKDLELSGAALGSSVAVVSQVHVYVPYPNKYVESEVNTLESDGKITFLVPSINRGKLDVVSLKATIDIYSGSEEKIATLETNEISLTSLERGEVFADWNYDVNPGRYKAIVTVRYDNEVGTVLKEFNVGELFLDIVEVNVRDFSLGDIAKFNALVENKWSSDLRDVYLNILVYNNEGEVMADFKSPTSDVGSLSKSELVAYWDTAGVHAGTYDGKLILRYGEKSTERNIELKISSSDLEVVGLTGNVLVKGGGSSLNTNVILILVVGILVVANIIWFVLIRKVLKKRR